MRGKEGQFLRIFTLFIGSIILRYLRLRCAELRRTSSRDRSKAFCCQNFFLSVHIFLYYALRGIE
jgi:hypothetical protein